LLALYFIETDVTLLLADYDVDKPHILKPTEKQNLNFNKLIQIRTALLFLRKKEEIKN